MRSDTQLAPPGKSKYNYSNASYRRILMMTYKLSKLGWTDQSSSVDICTWDYMSLHVAVTICATLVNTHRHSHRQTTFDWKYY